MSIRVYEVKRDDSYPNAVLAYHTDASKFVRDRDLISPIPLAWRKPPSEWHALEVRIVNNAKRSRRHGDFIGGPGGFLATRTVTKCLEAVLGDFVDWLPFRVAGSESTMGDVGELLWWMRPKCTIPALDAERSKCEYDDDEDRWGRRVLKHLSEYVFDEGKLHNVPVFLLPEYEFDRLFVTDTFVSLYEQNDWAGLKLVGL